MTRRRALALAAAAAACSTAAPPEQKNRCDVDTPCPEGQECIEGYCYESLLPPRAAIALDVRNDGFSDTPARVEILGEDTAVARILDRKPTRHRVSLTNTENNPGIRDRLEIFLQETTIDPAPDQPSKSSLAAGIELQQASRIGRAVLRVGGLSFPVLDPQTGATSRLRRTGGTGVCLAGLYFLAAASFASNPMIGPEGTPPRKVLAWP